MSLKIVGGKARGRKLLVPTRPAIRPTQILLKRRVFDSYQNMEGITFLDLCAGSGAMGLEAWSRGAKELNLVESNPKVFQTLKRNAEQVGGEEFLGREATIFCHREDVRSWLKRYKSRYLALSETERQQIILFLDPPYGQQEIYQEIMEGQLIRGGWFTGMMWLESDKLKGVPVARWENHLGLEQERCFQQGDSYLWIGQIAR